MPGKDLSNESPRDSSLLGRPCDGQSHHIAAWTDVAPLPDEAELCHTQSDPVTMDEPGSFDRQGETSPVVHRDALQEGMLPRDVPQRTTFYDPVAERQMTQTDAKLFYQRSKIDGRGVGSSSWAQTPPQGSSPLMPPGSRPATEYGADSLVLDPESGKPASPILLLRLGHRYHDADPFLPNLARQARRRSRVLHRGSRAAPWRGSWSTCHVWGARQSGQRL